MDFLKLGFQKVTSEKVEKIMNKINVKKARGADGIPAKIVKASKSVPDLHFFEKKGLTVFQKSVVFVPPEQRSKK
jgi:hypothetical protein